MDPYLESDPEIFAALRGEERREQRGVELIPSENYTYPEVLAALGSVLTNKYAEVYEFAVPVPGVPIEPS